MTGETTPLRTDATRTDASVAPVETQHERGLIEAARLFAEQGYAGTSMRQIAEAMGLTMGTLYHYFSSKEEILYQICRSTLSDGSTRLEDALTTLPADADELEAIRTGLHTHVRTISGSLNAQTTMLTEFRSLKGQNRAEIAALRRTYASVIEDLVRRGQATGAVRSDLTAEVITLLFFDLANWMIFWFREEGRLSADELATAMSAVLLDGIRGGTTATTRTNHHRADHRIDHDEDGSRS